MAMPLSISFSIPAWYSVLQHTVHFKAETPVANYDVVEQINCHKIRTFLQPFRYLYVRF